MEGDNVLFDKDAENVEDMNDVTRGVEDMNDVARGVEDMNDAARGANIDEEVLARQKILDKGKAVMTQDDSVKTKKRKNVRRGNGISIRENDNPLSSSNESDSEENVDEYGHIDSETDSDESDKSFDYLCNGENEVIELRKRKLDYKQGANEVDEQYEPTEADKDTTKVNEYFNGFGSNPLVRQHEKYMEALLRKIKDNGVGIIDPFTIVEKSKERYPIYDVLTHWKLKKPKLGEKFATIAQFKDCLTYYALANGFSLWFERSSNERVIAKCGGRKEKIKDPSKGKQRAYKKFPTNNEDKTVCKWRCYAKKLRGETTIQVISLEDTHTCVRNFNYGRLVSYKWIRRHFGDKIRNNPNITLDAIQELVMKKYKCIVSRTQCS